MAESALRRIARLADGWFPDDLDPSRPEAVALIGRMRQYVEAAGRQPSDLGIEGNLYLNRIAPPDWTATVAAWQAIGAEAVTLMTTLGGLTIPDAHVGLLERFKAETGLLV